MTVTIHVPFVAPDVATLVQGMTGRTGRRHALLMRAYGTRIVAGVSPKSDSDVVDGVPVFKTCIDAVDATGAIASVAMVPPLSVLDAVREAVTAGIKLI